MSTAQKIDTNLEIILKKLVPAFNPLKVFLFGSRAKNQHHNESDYDLFFIVDKSDQTHIKRIQQAHRLLWGLDVSVDIFIYTQAEFNEWKDETSSIANIARTEGVEILLDQ